MRNTEGMDPMPLKALIHLAKILSRSKNKELIACHLFLLLDWNMVSRAESVVNAHIDLFGIYEDALLVHLGPSKGDQEGTKHACHPWHLYSVPQEPAICPVLAFAKYLVTHSETLGGDCKVSHLNVCSYFTEILTCIESTFLFRYSQDLLSMTDSTASCVTLFDLMSTATLLLALA